MTAQLILYKHFWSRKHNVPLKDIRCGFILLKRGGKPGNMCELVPVSVGPKSLDRATKMMSNMIINLISSKNERTRMANKAREIGKAKSRKGFVKLLDKYLSE